MTERSMAPWYANGASTAARELWFTSHHEAGHAVAACVLGIGVTMTTITLGEDGHAITGVELPVAGMDDPAWLADRLSRIVVARSGLLADAKLGRGAWQPAVGDTKAATSIAEGIASRALMSDVMRGADNRARLLLHDAWPAVRAVADALLAPPHTLDGAAVVAIVRDKAADSSWYWPQDIASWARSLLFIPLTRYRVGRTREVLGV